MIVQDLLTLDGQALVDKASELFEPKGERVHWSVPAVLLGRIADVEAYRDSCCGTIEGFGKRHHDLAGGEVRLHLLLWRLIQQGQAGGIEPGEWAALSKAKALLLHEVFGVGGTPRTWFARALAAATLEAFQHEVDKHLARQPFTTLKVRVPVDLVPVFKAALKRVLPSVLEGEAPATDDPNSDRYWLDLVEDPKYTFRCWEALAVHALQTLPEPVFLGQQELS
jgi:hypothetical protein